MSQEEIKVDGISQFFWMAIPAVLALAGLLWIAFYMGIHDARHQISVEDQQKAQEQRSNQAVGAAVLPKAPIQIVLKNRRTSCRIIDKAYLDGSDLWVYWHKVCSDNYGIPSDTIRWASLSPDGTVIGGDYERVPVIEVGQKGEFHTDKVIADPRVAKIEIHATWNDSD